MNDAEVAAMELQLVSAFSQVSAEFNGANQAAADATATLQQLAKRTTPSKVNRVLRWNIRFLLATYRMDAIYARGTFIAQKLQEFRTVKNALAMVAKVNLSGEQISRAREILDDSPVPEPAP